MSDVKLAWLGMQVVFAGSESSTMKFLLAKVCSEKLGCSEAWNICINIANPVNISEQQDISSKQVIEIQIRVGALSPCDTINN